MSYPGSRVLPGSANTAMSTAFLVTPLVVEASPPGPDPQILPTSGHTPLSLIVAADVAPPGTASNAAAIAMTDASTRVLPSQVIMTRPPSMSWRRFIRLVHYAG